MKLNYLMLPFAWIHALLIRLRNHLFDLGVWKSVEFEFPIIYVGSISNATQILACSNFIFNTLAKASYKGAIHVNKQELSKHHLERVASKDLLYLNEVKPIDSKEQTASYFVTRNKILGVSEYYQLYPDVDFVVMDSHFGMNEIRPSLKVLVIDESSPFYRDSISPVGTLTESKASAKSADVVWVTSACCLETRSRMKSELEKYLDTDAMVCFFAPTPDEHKAADKIDNQQDRDNFVALIEKHVNSVKNIASEE